LASTKPEEKCGWFLVLTLAIYSIYRVTEEYSVTGKAENWVKRVGEL
jgi:hypothetical protein